MIIFSQLVLLAHDVIIDVFSRLGTAHGVSMTLLPQLMPQPSPQRTETNYQARSLTVTNSVEMLLVKISNTPREKVLGYLLTEQL